MVTGASVQTGLIRIKATIQLTITMRNIYAITQYIIGVPRFKLVNKAIGYLISLNGCHVNGDDNFYGFNSNDNNIYQSLFL